MYIYYYIYIYTLYNNNVYYFVSLGSVIILFLYFFAVDILDGSTRRLNETIRRGRGGLAAQLCAALRSSAHHERLVPSTVSSNSLVSSTISSKRLVQSSPLTVSSDRIIYNVY